jgi:hypothetical protein
MLLKLVNIFLYFSILCIVGGQLDVRRQPHFGTQFVKEPCVYLSSRAYGSNTAYCLRERNQRFLLSTQGNVAGWKTTEALAVFLEC